MNLKITVTALFITVSMWINAQTSGEFNRLWNLYNQKEYFKLNSAFKQSTSNLSDGENLLISGLLERVFNMPAESNEKLERVLKRYNTGLNDSMMMEIYQSQMLNYVSMFDYKKAVLLTSLLLANYKSMLDSTDIEDYNNANIIWESGKDIQPQTCVKSGDTKIKVKKDMAGLVNVNLKVNGVESEFIFDTGANFSTITKSLAKKLGLKFLVGKLKVGTASDIKIDAELAYADSLEIGNIKYHYVLFLVLPDEALTFAGGLYKIDGIIGFPVIKEMKEINLTHTHLFVPLVTLKKETMNLSLNSFTPVINVTRNNDSLIFTFDTGARKTSLYYKYYEKYKTFIDGNYEMEELEIEGAGGKQTVKGFTIDKINLSAGSITQKLTDVKLYAEKFKDKDKYFYGNMGQDFFSNSDKLIINFEYMYIEITNE